MLQIRNISNYRWAISTYSSGTSAIPPFFNLGPVGSLNDNTVYLLKENLKKYGTGVKQAIADAVQAGLILVEELNASHLGFDKSPLTEYALVPANLDQVLASANYFKVIYNYHDSNLVFHTGLGANKITSPDATDVASLIVLLTEAQIDYDAHRINAAIHPPSLDTKNATTLSAPTDLITSVAVLKELWQLYKQHRRWAVRAATAPLNPSAIITY